MDKKTFRKLYYKESIIIHFHTREDLVVFLNCCKLYIDLAHCFIDRIFLKKYRTCNPNKFYIRFKIGTSGRTLVRYGSHTNNALAMDKQEVFFNSNTNNKFKKYK